MTESLDTLLDAAMAMARKAGEVHLSHFRSKGLKADAKFNESDVVTVADREAERVILEEIRRRFPDHSAMSEESGGSEAAEGVRWVIDPLDGTTNFSQGLPLFSVSIGIEIDRRQALGVVYAPVFGEMFHAMAGKGAFLNGERITCSAKTTLDKAVVATGFPVDKDSNPDNNLDNVARIMPAVRGLRRLGSAALDLCYVGAGFLDGYWEMNLHEWDVAAGRLIAEEAGARYGIWREGRGVCALAASPALYPLLKGMLR